MSKVLTELPVGERTREAAVRGSGAFYSDAEVAQKIGVTPSWVNMIVGLLEKGEEVLVWDDLSTGRMANLHRCLGRPGFRYIIGDFTRDPTFERCVEQAAVRLCPSDLRHDDVESLLSTAGAHG